MTTKPPRTEMLSSEVRTKWREAQEHVTRGGEVVVTHYTRKVALITPYKEEGAMEFTLNELILIQNGLATLEDDYGVDYAAPVRERIDAEIDRRKAQEGA